MKTALCLTKKYQIWQRKWVSFCNFRFTYHHTIVFAAKPLNNKQPSILEICYNTVYHPQNADNTLQWRHNEHDGIWNHLPHDCLLNRLFKHRSKKTLKLGVTGLCEGNSPVAGEFPAQMASNTELVSIWWCHHEATHEGKLGGVYCKAGFMFCLY